MTPEEAYDLGKRIPELEPVISQDTFSSYWYALNVIKGKWKKGEPAISKNAQCSYYYARHIIKGRWELAEPTISKNAFYSCWYAKYVIEGKLPDFMHNQMILNNDESTKEYVKFIK